MYKTTIQCWRFHFQVHSQIHAIGEGTTKYQCFFLVLRLLHSYSNCNANVIMFQFRLLLNSPKCTIQCFAPSNMANSVLKNSCFYNRTTECQLGNLIENFEVCFQLTSALYHHWWLLDFLWPYYLLAPNACFKYVKITKFQSKSLQNFNGCSVSLAKCD